MKARVLKKLLNDTGYAIHETSEHICIGSPLCSDLISIRKDNLQLRYALDTFHEGKASIKHPPLIAIWERLEELIACGEIHKFIHGEDEIDNPLPVFSYDENHEIIRSFTDAYGWPNTDIKGRIMYDNTWFPTELEAIEKAISDCSRSIKWREETVQEKQSDIAKLEEKICVSKASLARLEAMKSVRGAA